MSDENEPRYEHPVNPLPPMVVAIALVLGAIEVIFQIGSLGIVGGPDAIGWRVEALQTFSFIDHVFEQMRTRGFWPLEHVQRFFTYAFVHASPVSTLLAIVFILALGKMVGELFGNLAVLLIFVVTTLAGSLTYGLVLTTDVPLYGAFPAAYGFIGAYTFILWVGLGQMNQNRLGAFRLIGLLMGIQLIFGLIYGGNPDWIARLAGFVAGFATAGLLVPGAFGRILGKLRQR